MSKELMLAKNIKKFRAKAGLTQEALARQADVSYNTIIKLETEGIKDPRISTIIKIANALAISIDELTVRKKHKRLPQWE